MSSGESFGVDLAIPAGGFCFSALSFTGVGGDVGSRGGEWSPAQKIGQGHVVFIIAVVSNLRR